MNSRPAGGTTGWAAGEVPVLMYHSIDTGATRKFRRFAVSPEEFAAQMDHLDVEGYRTLTAADFAGQRGSGTLTGRPVVLTFDDAYADFYSAALPILRQHGFSATLYVPTAYVGATTRFNRNLGEQLRKVLSWQALSDIAAAGIEVAAHSHTHPQLDRVPADVVKDEVSRSRFLLEDKLGIKVEGFAYPFGFWDDAARVAVADAGFGYAVAVADLMTTPDGDALTLPRLTVNAGIGVAGLARLLDSRNTASRRQKAVLKQVAWRAARRAVPFVGGNPREGGSAG
jgi:peptidoglycan/xylan/chitin deacetylase (PgdA/CDA1 family)